LKTVALGNLSKMSHRLASPVTYNMVLGSEEIPLNEFIGQTLQLTFTGEIHCCHCGRKTKKSFNQGYCFPCMKKLAQCDSCIMSPEKCHFSAGTCREPEWGRANCMITHYVYLANSSGLKVGITRHTQVPTRWIDQGAIQALPVFAVSSRRLSGLVEVLFRDLITDRTNWRAMLKGQVEAVDMLAARDSLLVELNDRLALLMREEQEDFTVITNADVVHIQYPVATYPSKITSLNAEKQPVIEGQLQGIKGQYLILDTGCINIRKYTAYEASLAI